MKLENMKKLNLTQRQILCAYNFDGARLVDVIETGFGDSYLSFENYKRLKKDGMYEAFTNIIEGMGISDHLSNAECLFFKNFCIGKFGKNFDF